MTQLTVAFGLHATYTGPRQCVPVFAVCEYEVYHSQNKVDSPMKHLRGRSLHFCSPGAERDVRIPTKLRF